MVALGTRWSCPRCCRARRSPCSALSHRSLDRRAATCWQACGRLVFEAATSGNGNMDLCRRYYRIPSFELARTSAKRKQQMPSSGLHLCMETTFWDAFTDIVSDKNAVPPHIIKLLCLMLAGYFIIICFWSGRLIIDHHVDFLFKCHLVVILLNLWVWRSKIWRIFNLNQAA